ncbi:MAG: glycyl-radical enzyme activating protein [Clostridia bacterium]|nr:glycyl-radical enzyme activating protein [Clostridia bacterium]
MTGVVFDIEEFAVYDGPGIRSVVFMKGCPLRCAWCHNPEGLKPFPQRLKSREMCHNCGACEVACPSLGNCTACGECVKVCPAGCLRIAGREMTPEDVARKVRRVEKLLKMNGGGVTFSGGEALMQADFVIAARELLPGLHAAIETSGYAKAEVFEKVVERMDMVLFDIKLVDREKHKRWVGVDNALIQENLKRLIESGVPFRARVPLIPGVNDDMENLEATARLLEGAKNLDRVELLRYNRAAGAKYSQLNMSYAPEFDEDKSPNADLTPFTRRGMEGTIL